MEIRVVNYNNSYYIPTLEDFRTRKVKIFEEGTPKQGILNPDISDMIISSESSIIVWKTYDNTTLNYDAWKHSISWHLERGLIRVKKENNMGNTTKDLFNLTPAIRKETLAPLALIKESVIEAQNILISKGANAEEVKFKANEILVEKLRKRAEDLGSKAEGNLKDGDIENIFKGIYVAALNTDKGIYTIKIKTKTESTSSNEEVRSFIDSLVTIASTNQFTSTLDLLDHVLHPDGRTVREDLEQLTAKIGEPIIIEDYQYLIVPIVAECIATDEYNHLNKYAAGVSYTYKGKFEDTHKVIRKVLAHIIFAKPICVKEEDLLKSVIDKEKDFIIADFTKDSKNANKSVELLQKITEGKINAFKKDVVLYMNEPTFDEKKRTIGAILKEANIEILDFIYV
jgi:elongation factor Ts